MKRRRREDDHELERAARRLPPDHRRDHRHGRDAQLSCKQAALLIADQAGKIAIEAQLVTTEAEMAEALASIVRGLISLTMFSEDMDPDTAHFLQNTDVEVDGNKLTIDFEKAGTKKVLDSFVLGEDAV